MEQVERTERYLNRIRKIYEGTSILWEERRYYEDDVISFFMHCYHIKDWIVKLNKVKVTSSEIDDFINQHEALKICADLCNGSKHCELTRTPRTGQQPHVASSEYWADNSDQSTVVIGKFSVLSNGDFHDALDLAEKCMALWNRCILLLHIQARRKVVAPHHITAAFWRSRPRPVFGKLWRHLGSSRGSAA